MKLINGLNKILHLILSFLYSYFILSPLKFIRKFQFNVKSIFIIFLILGPIGYIILKYCISDINGSKNPQILFELIPASTAFILTLIFQKDKIWGNAYTDFKSKYLSLEKKYLKDKADKDKLEEVVKKFLNDGKFNRKDILKKLKVDTDSYFCIIKSKEEMEYLFQQRNRIDPQKKLDHLPFGEILDTIQGRLKPFGNMDIYFIPFSVINKKYKLNIRKWMEGYIIPKVEQLRIQYVDKFKNELQITPIYEDKLKKLSHVYIAFSVNKGNFDYDIKNTKINDDFFELLKNNTASLESYTDDIVESIRSSDMFLNINWSTIVSIRNKEYIYALEQENEKITNHLNNEDINSIIDLINYNEENLTKIFLKVFKNKKYNWTDRICKNNAKKVINSIKDLVHTLRNAGVNI